jgi:hypothetical protein
MRREDLLVQLDPLVQLDLQERLEQMVQQQQGQMAKEVAVVV